MLQYKCRSCGGQMDFGGAGGFSCPYCGSKSFMSDADLREHEEFRKKLLAYYKAEAINKEFDYTDDTLWECRGVENFTLSNGQNLTIQYMWQHKYSECVCYLAKETVVYVFSHKKAKDQFLAGLKQLVFPEADNKLARCFPKLKMELSLNDKREVLVLVRRPNFYPAELFAPLSCVHLAWVISRMENLCCALEYSQIEHGGICPSAIWINPITHEGALFGDWNAVRKKHRSKDLQDLRKTAIALSENTRDPLELYEFLMTKPAQDAYEDFSAWDNVIEKGFGGHKFTKM